MINEGNLLPFFLMLGFIGNAEPTASWKFIPDSVRFIPERVLSAGCKRKLAVTTGFYLIPISG